jgi:sec-independent protein translocase protein TatA
MGGLSITHWLIVILAIVLLFGARRLPDTARGLARSLRIFKSEINHDDAPAPARDSAATREPADLAPWPKLENPASPTPSPVADHSVDSTLHATVHSTPPDEARTAR